MTDTVLIGRNKHMLRISSGQWEQHLDEAPSHGRKRLAFMTDEHHRVRYFVVETLPKFNKPISAAMISDVLDIPPTKVISILDDLEKNLFFLVCGEKKEVTWAYPITTDITSHKIKFSSGEQIYAA